MSTGPRVNGKKLWVECKHIESLGSIKKNAKDASKQLEKLFAEKIGSGLRGIIALDISKILNPSNKTFSAENDQELVRSARLMMDQFIYQNSQIWQKDFEQRLKKIIGTIIRFAFMYHSEIRNIPVYTSYFPMGDESAFEY